MLEDNGDAYAFEEYKAVLDLIYRKYFELPDHPEKLVYDRALGKLREVCGK